MLPLRNKEVISESALKPYLISALQITGVIEDNSKIIFLIFQQKYTL